MPDCKPTPNSNQTKNRWIEVSENYRLDRELVVAGCFTVLYALAAYTLSYSQL